MEQRRRYEEIEGQELWAVAEAKREFERPSKGWESLLAQLSKFDDLYSLEGRAQRAVEHASENERPVTLLLIRLRGRPPRRYVAKLAELLCAQAYRAADHVCTLEHDTFAIILADTDDEGARVVARRIVDSYTATAALTALFDEGMLAIGMVTSSEKLCSGATLVRTAEKHLEQAIERTEHCVWTCQGGQLFEAAR